MAYDDAIRRQWQTVRVLERDLEKAMTVYNRATDGLGFAAVASWLEAQGWRKGTAAERVAESPRPPSTLVAQAAPHLAKIAEHYGVKVSAMKAHGYTHDNQVKAARRESYRVLVEDVGMTVSDVGLVFNRHRATIRKGMRR